MSAQDQGASAGADQAGRAAPRAANASRPSGDHPSRERLLALAERCEAASGPSLELNCRIWAAINGGGYDTFIAVVPDLSQWASVKPYTASLDAAMTLVPDGCNWHADATAPECGIDFFVGSEGLAGTWPKGTAATPALALCAAALRARAGEP